MGVWKRLGRYLAVCSLALLLAAGISMAGLTAFKILSTESVPAAPSEADLASGYWVQVESPAGNPEWPQLELQLLRPLIFLPSVFHYEVFLETSACLGARADFGAITWVIAEAIWETTQGFWAAGAYFRDSHFIILTNTHVWDPFVVSHELIHALTQLPDPFPPEIKACELGRLDS